MPYCLWLLFAFNDKCLLVLFSLIYSIREMWHLGLRYDMFLHLKDNRLTSKRSLFKMSQ